MFSYYARWIQNFSEKIRPTFALSSDAATSFELLWQNLASTCLTGVKEGIPFVVECDVPDHALAATLNQGGQPLVFYLHTFLFCKSKNSTVEKKASAIIHAVRK